MIQDIAPQTLHNQFVFKKPDANACAMIFSENKILVRQTDKGMELPRAGELQNVDGWQYLFRIDEAEYYLYMDFGQAAVNKLENKYRFEKVSDIRYMADNAFCLAAYTAYHLYQWYRDNQFCGRCGRRTVPDTRERMLYCPSCGNQIYPKIAPAVIVAVTDGGRIVLSKYAGRAYKRYALIAGFTEIGETAEETVRREVMEEIGLQVTHIRYYKTQPWGIASNLLIGYFADLKGDAAIRIDHNELAVAEWMEREALKEIEGFDDPVSLTMEMIRAFYEGKIPE